MKEKNKTFITVEDWQKEYTPSNLDVDEFSAFNDDVDTLALFLADKALNIANEEIYSIK